MNMFRRKAAGWKESKERPKENDGSAMDCAPGRNTPVPQEVQHFSDKLAELQHVMGPLQDSMQGWIKDSQEKDDRIQMQEKKIDSLELDNKELKQLLSQRESKMEDIQLQMESSAEQLSAEIGVLKDKNSALEMQLGTEVHEKFELSEELKVLRKDFHDSEMRIGHLNQELKEARAAEEKSAFLVAQLQALREDKRDLKMKYEDMKVQYDTLLAVSGTIDNERSELKTRYEQLRMDLEQANKMVRAAESELNELKTAAQEQKAKEERLQRQLLEKEEKISDMEQRHDAEKRLLQEQNMELLARLEMVITGYDQHMKDVAVFAMTPVDQGGQMQATGQHGRNNIRSRHKAHDSEGAASIDLSMDQSDIWNETVYSSSPSQSLPIPQLPIDNLPQVTTEILSHYVARMVPRWYELGHALGMHTEADALLHSEHSAERKCLLCLKAWIDNGGPDCSWERLFRELCSFQLYSIAKNIRDELQEIVMATSNHSL